MPVIWWVLSALILALVVALSWAVHLYRRVSRERSSRQSLSTTYGKLTEQFLPFVDSYPWDPTKFRFLGSPVDGIQFEEDRIVIVEFKVGRSQLTPTQRRIRDLVRAHKVDFQEIRIR